MAAVFSFAVDAAKMFGFLKEGPSSLERLVVERFDDLEKRVTAVAKLIVTQDLRTGRIAVENFVSTVKNYVAQLERHQSQPRSA